MQYPAREKSSGLTFIEQEDLRVSDQGTSDSDSLLLSSRQLRSLVTHERVEAIGQADDKVVLETDKLNLAKAIQVIRLGLAYDIGVLASLNQLFLRNFSGRFVCAEPIQQEQYRKSAPHQGQAPS
jgi:hypothetical protein